MQKTEPEVENNDASRPLGEDDSASRPYRESTWTGYENHPDNPAASFAGRGPKGYVRSDERIHEDVCERLTDAPDVDASDVTVTIAQGEITLAGEVVDRTAKHRTEEIAENVRGVRTVHNELRVRRPPA